MGPVVAAKRESIKTVQRLIIMWSLHKTGSHHIVAATLCVLVVSHANGMRLHNIDKRGHSHTARTTSSRIAARQPIAIGDLVERIHLRTPAKRWTAAEWARWCVKYHRRRRHDDALQLIWAEFCERPYRGIRRVRRSGSILGATPLKLHVATLTNPASGKRLLLTLT